MAQKKRWNGDIENIALQESSDNSLQEKSLLQNRQVRHSYLSNLPTSPPKKKKKEKKEKIEKKRRNIERRKRKKCIPLCRFVYFELRFKEL